MTNQQDKTAIDAVFRQLSQAHEDRNADAILNHYAVNAEIYDVAPPLVRHGLDRGELEAWLQGWDGPIRLVMRDLDIEIAGDLAVARGLRHLHGFKQGEEQDLWFRATTCLHKHNGHWQIFHDHESVPFYMDGSDKAAVDLLP